MRTLPFAAVVLSVLSLTSHRPLALQGATGSLADARQNQFEIALPPDSELNSIAPAPDSRIVVSGWTSSDAFPITPGAVQAQCDRTLFGYCLSPFVMVFSPRGDLLYSTFVGGEGPRWLTAATPDPGGGIWLLLGGAHQAPDPLFPECGMGQSVLAHIRPGLPGYDRFACDDPYAPWLGAVWGMTVARDGTIWLVGTAEPSTAIATKNAWQPRSAGGTDVFAIRYSAGSQEILVGTYLGGRDRDYATAMAIAPDGDLVIVGRTQSVDFPAVRPLQDRLGASRSEVGDAFITRLDEKGRLLDYSTWLGGAEDDGARGVSVDASGNAYVIGDTGSADFPVTAGTAGTRIWPGPWSGFLASVDATGRLRFSTRASEGQRYMMARDDGSVFVAGATCQPDFPRAGRVPRLWPSNPLCPYPFFVHTDPFASALVRSTLVPVVTGLDPKVDTPTPRLGMGNWIEAAAFDANYLYLAGNTVLWYRPSPTSDMLHLRTGHYLKKWYIGDPPEWERGRDRR